MEQKLSDAFAIPTDNPELELKVQIININPGMNEELKAKCPARFFISTESGGGQGEYL